MSFQKVLTSSTSVYKKILLTPVVLKRSGKMSDLTDSENEVDVVEETWNMGC
jgi:hypothetical protein